jgi:formiminoglutamate deiminase
VSKLVLAEALLAEGWRRDVAVEIVDGRFARVTPDAPPGDAPRLDGPVLAGLPNLHSHAFQRGMAGLAERAGGGDDSFWSWREVMYSFLDRLTPDDIEALAAWAYIEMAEAGFTAVAEFHYLHHGPDGAPYASLAEMGERIAAAAEQSGIGLTLLPVLYRFAGFGQRPPEPRQRRFLNDPDRFARLLEASERAVKPLAGAVVGLAPHSLRAVGLDDLRLLAEMRGASPIHIHVAEQEKEVADCLAWSGQRPVELLLATGLVDRRWCLVHATHMSETETGGLAASGAVAGLCPITEANLGDGIFPAIAYRGAGGLLGVGTDSNVLISGAEELRTLEYGQRLVSRRRNRLADAGASVGRALVEAACHGGARACGRPVGAIAPGQSADLVLLDRSAPALAGRSGDQALDGWIFACAQPAVREVWIAGRRVVVDGRHVARDRLAPRFRAVMERLAA